MPQRAQCLRTVSLEGMEMLKKRLDEATRKRVAAGRLLAKGKKPGEVAVAVGVARQTAYVWKNVFDEGGIDALRAMAAPGRPARLGQSERAGLRSAGQNCVAIGAA